MSDILSPAQVAEIRADLVNIALCHEVTGNSGSLGGRAASHGLALCDSYDAQARRIAELEMWTRDMAPQKYPVLVVCALIVRDGRVLLERHAPSIEYATHMWDIPGGKVEIGELPRDAVIREIQEEMGVVIEPICLLPSLEKSVWTDAPGARHWILATYECRIVSGEPRLTEDLQWLDIETLSAGEVKAPDLEIIRGFVSQAAAIEHLKADASTVAHLRSVVARINEGKEAGAHLSDSVIAGLVRMLGRSDSEHEIVCVMGRDRIIALSDEVARLKAKLAQAERDSVRLDKFIEMMDRSDIEAMETFWDTLPGESDNMLAEVRLAIDAAMQPAEQAKEQG